MRSLLPVTASFSAALLAGCTTLLGIDGDYMDGTGAGGGTAGVGAGGVGATGGGGTGAVAGSEVCDNGKDDDNDGLADCADPGCQALGFQCVPQPPAGWLGPVRLQSDSPSCLGTWGVEHAKGGFEVEVPQGGSCPTCSCGAGQGVKCGRTIRLYNQPNCAGNTNDVVMQANGLCLNWGMQSLGPKSGRALTALQVVEGSCPPSAAGTASIPAASFTAEAVVCRPASQGAGCASVDYCAPPSGNGSIACVARTGDHTCPGPYSVKQVMYQGIADGRACSSCSCAAPTSQCLGGEIRANDASGDCLTAQGTPFTSACIPIAIHTSGTFQTESTLAVTNDASCTPIQSTVSGSVASDDPLTVCCTPE